MSDHRSAACLSSNLSERRNR